MRYIALNGFGHSLRRYFNDRVECIDRTIWTRRAAENVIRKIKEPVTIFGFSMGATAALQMANQSQWIHEVYAHSPERLWWNGEAMPEVTIIRTIGDTTPTFAQALETHRSWKYSRLIDLPPLEHIPVTDVITWVMRRRSHQYHNSLHLYPQHLISKQFTASTISDSSPPA
jgi:pimeloyl-ACP methyl ester carboxylesterase